MASPLINSQSRSLHRCASRRGVSPWSTLNETSPCPHCPTWLSHSGTLRKHIQRFHTSPRLAPSLDLCEWNFSDADAVEECRRRRGSRARLGNADWTIEATNTRRFYCIRTFGVHLESR